MRMSILILLYAHLFLDFHEYIHNQTLGKLGKDLEAWDLIEFPTSVDDFFFLSDNDPKSTTKLFQCIAEEQQAVKVPLPYVQIYQVCVDCKIRIWLLVRLK